MSRNDEMIEYLKAKDERFLEYIFNKYYRNLCLYSIRYMIDRDDAEDIVQSVFISFWNNKKGLEFTGSIKSYLYGATTKACLKHLRDKGQVYFVDIEECNSESLNQLFSRYDNTGEYEREKEQIINSISDKIQELSEQQQKVLNDIILNKKSYKEIAEKLDISVNTVKTHYIRALNYLRKRIDTKTLLLFMYISEDIYKPGMGGGNKTLICKKQQHRGVA